MNDMNFFNEDTFEISCLCLMKDVKDNKIDLDDISKVITLVNGTSKPQNVIDRIIKRLDTSGELKLEMRFLNKEDIKGLTYYKEGCVLYKIDCGFEVKNMLETFIADRTYYIALLPVRMLYSSKGVKHLFDYLQMDKEDVENEMLMQSINELTLDDKAKVIELLKASKLNTK